MGPGGILLREDRVKPTSSQRGAIVPQAKPAGSRYRAGSAEGRYGLCCLKDGNLGVLITGSGKARERGM
jgi:hypothetical protein